MKQDSPLASFNLLRSSLPGSRVAETHPGAIYWGQTVATSQQNILSLATMTTSIRSPQKTSQHTRLSRDWLDWWLSLFWSDLMPWFQEFVLDLRCCIISFVPCHCVRFSCSFFLCQFLVVQSQHHSIKGLYPLWVSPNHRAPTEPWTARCNHRRRHRLGHIMRILVRC